MHAAGVHAFAFAAACLCAACGAPNGSTAPDAGHAPSPGCVDAALGMACDPPACNQPSNPCATGYIWACDYTWIHETIVCFTDSSEKTRTTAGCGPNEVLYVDDVAGTPCNLGGPGPDDAGDCGDGGYLYEQDCCEYPTDAYCVPVPSACGGTLDCSCANPVCGSQCNGATGGLGGPGIMCAAASSGIVDCLCGKL